MENGKRSILSNQYCSRITASILTCAELFSYTFVEKDELHLSFHIQMKNDDSRGKCWFIDLSFILTNRNREQAKYRDIINSSKENLIK